MADRYADTQTNGHGQKHFDRYIEHRHRRQTSSFSQTEDTKKKNGRKDRQIRKQKHRQANTDTNAFTDVKHTDRHGRQTCQTGMKKGKPKKKLFLSSPPTKRGGG